MLAVRRHRLDLLGVAVPAGTAAERQREPDTEPDRTRSMTPTMTSVRREKLKPPRPPFDCTGGGFACRCCFDRLPLGIRRNGSRVVGRGYAPNARPAATRQRHCRDGVWRTIE